jgi:hypothetical protein
LYVVAFARSGAPAGRADWNGNRGCFPGVQEAFKMKMLIFLIFFALVVSVVLWKVRKADAERDLARRKALSLKKNQRKEAIKAEVNVTWPTIIKSVGKSPEDEDGKLPEPSMSTIEFKPVDHPSLQH